MREPEQLDCEDCDAPAVDLFYRGHWRLGSIALCEACEQARRENDESLESSADRERRLYDAHIYQLIDEARGK